MRRSPFLRVQLAPRRADVADDDAELDTRSAHFAIGPILDGAIIPSIQDGARVFTVERRPASPSSNKERTDVNPNCAFEPHTQ